MDYNTELTSYNIHFVPRTCTHRQLLGAYRQKLNKYKVDIDSEKIDVDRLTTQRQVARPTSPSSL